MVRTDQPKYMARDLRCFILSIDASILTGSDVGVLGMKDGVRESKK